jgi:hypothetical protein
MTISEVSIHMYTFWNKNYTIVFIKSYSIPQNNLVTIHDYLFK